MAAPGFQPHPTKQEISPTLLFWGTVLTQWLVNPTFYLSCQTGTVPNSAETADMLIHYRKRARNWEVGEGRDHGTSVKPQPSKGQALGKGVFYYLFYFYSFCLFAFSRAIPVAYGVSQARDLIGAVATGLCQSHSNTGSEPRLQPTP